MTNEKTKTREKKESYMAEIISKMNECARVNEMASLTSLEVE